jgi:signal transduction histidine kinase
MLRLYQGRRFVQLSARRVMCNLRALLCLVFISFSTSFFLSVSVYADDVQQKPVLALAGAVEPISLISYLAVYEDSSRQLDFAQIRSAPLANQFKQNFPAAESFDFGFNQSSYWFRLRLVNASAEALPRLLQIDYPLLTRIEMFYPQANGEYLSKVTGFDQPFSTYAYPNRHFVFPLELPANSDQLLYFRIDAIDAMVVPVKLWDPESFYLYERTDYFGQAFYFGMAGAMVLFNLLFFLGAARNSNYLLYVSFGTCFILTMANKNGLAHEFLWQNATTWSNISEVSGFALSLGTLMIFMRRMLDTKMNLPRADKLLKLIISLLFITPFFLAYSLQTFITKAAALYGIAALVILVTSIYCAWQRQRSAYFFVAAFSFWVLGTAFVVLRAFGLMSTNFLTVYGIQIGSIFEMLLLALALADRFNVLRRENEAARSGAIQAKEALVTELRDSEQMLEVNVQLRTYSLAQTLSRLRKARDELVQSAKLAALGSIVASVAHELNRPIGNAVMSASALEDVTNELHGQFNAGTLRKSTLAAFIEKTGPMAKMVLNACKSAADLVASFKRVAVDQTTEKRREFNLRSVVEDIVATQKLSYRREPWEFLLEVPQDLICDSYPGPLGQIIANLMQNAVLHGFAGRRDGCLRIQAQYNEDVIEMNFVDDGIGIAASVLGHIFDPFFTTKSHAGGSGLGLTISMNIATGVLGGGLRCNSVVGEGTTFRLWFPVVAPENRKKNDHE